MQTICGGKCKPSLAGIIVFILSVVQIAAFICDFQTLSSNDIDWRAFGIVQAVFAGAGFLVAVAMSLSVSCGTGARGFKSVSATLMWREAINSSVTSIFQSAFILALYTEDETHHCEGAIFPVTIVCALFAFSNVFYLICGPVVPDTLGT